MAPPARLRPVGQAMTRAVGFIVFAAQNLMRIPKLSPAA